MKKILRTKRARQDLIDIWRHVAEDSPEAGDGLLDAIDAKCQLLASHPSLGPERNDIREGLRYIRAGQYLVLYQVAGQAVRIVRVLHGRRDLHGVFSA
jgi:toxin ParE1/3/4